MAEPNSEQFWKEFLINAEIDQNDATHYAKVFVQQDIRTTILCDLEADDLRAMGITKIGQIKLILKYAAMTYNNLPTESSKDPSDLQGITLENAFRDFNIEETLRKMELLEQVQSSASDKMNKLECILKDVDFPEMINNLKALKEAQDELRKLKKKEDDDCTSKADGKRKTCNEASAITECAINTSAGDVTQKKIRLADNASTHEIT